MSERFHDLEQYINNIPPYLKNVGHRSEDSAINKENDIVQRK